VKPGRIRLDELRNGDDRRHESPYSSERLVGQPKMIRR
jgi:hypothetical protein